MRSIIELLHNMPEDYVEKVKALMNEKLHKKYKDDQILAKGKELMQDPEFEWMLDVLRNIENTPALITKGNSTIGIHYEDDSEVGDGYVYDKSLDYRIPTGYVVDEAGIILYLSRTQKSLKCTLTNVSSLIV